MHIQERLLEDMKQAMRAREKERLQTIRMLRSELLNAEIDAGGELSEEAALRVLSRELKRRRESLAEFQKANRPQQVEALQREIEWIQAYLPEPLSSADIERLAREAIAEVGAAGPQDAGKVMSRLMPRVQGRADGSMVSRIVRQLLGSRES